MRATAKNYRKEKQRKKNFVFPIYETNKMK